jgi:4-amino-4-deoxy-L-arabinose transferase-like glycosyltransferase
MAGRLPGPCERQLTQGNNGMFRQLAHPWLHLPLLLLSAAALFFLNLGTPSLWDIDEGNNAEAAREMLEAGDWVVPTFNYQLRVDKPALLYWLQMAAYRIWGVNEFSARLPSALASLAAVLVVYLLGWRLFGVAEGFLGGLILASSPAFCAAAHFANPDALLNLCTTATLALFWTSYTAGKRTWFWSAALTAGFGVLAKGPVGLILPATVVSLFLLWERKLTLLRDARLVGGLVLFAAVVVPWYAWVGVETKGDFLRGFLLQHNFGRYLSPMERHGGPPFYYLAVVLAGAAPWSVFLAWTCWFGTGRRARADANPERLPSSYRFLWCWIAIYFVFFSLAGTKLPNYILPLYAPLSLLTARFLERWRTGALSLRLPMYASMTCLALMGLGTALALLLVGGQLPGDLLHGQYLPGLERWAWLGSLPLLAAAAGWYFGRTGRSDIVVTGVALTALLFTGGLICCASVTLDEHKAVRALTAGAETCQPQNEIRLAAFGYFQPSLVFYGQREVTHLDSEKQTRDFLLSPLPVFLFVPQAAWQSLSSNMPAPCRVVDRHYDLYRRCQVVVVSNH